MISTTTTATATKKDVENDKAGCPYAQQHPETSSTNGNKAPSSSSWSNRLKECPAFQQKCPFSDAASQHDVQATLLQIPKSHLTDPDFRNALNQLHATPQPDHPDPQYRIPGGSCPVQGYLPESVPFVETLEECSLAAIMGRMAQDFLAAQDNTLETSATQQQTKTEESSLAKALKAGTAASHQAAENVHFVSNFIQGKIDRNLYGHLVANLYYIYKTLEELLDQHAPRHFGTCHFPKELNRTAALQEDVDFWHTRLPPPSPATADYVQRLQDIAQDDSAYLLLAHAYTRYLGDLSGGTILARVARRALQLKNSDGLRFYAFDHISRPKAFKDTYRARMDALEWTPQQVDALVYEANVAFLLNMRIFEELDVQGGVVGATVRPLQLALHPKLEPAPPGRYSVTTHSKSQRDKNPAPCPFAKTAATPKKGKCPWPFVLLHDPREGMRAWQTWLTLGVVSAWMYKAFLSA